MKYGGRLLTSTLLGLASLNIFAAEELAGFSKDSLQPDEAGLWMVVEKQEQSIRTSSILVDDPALNQYVSDILCSLTGESCSYLRAYIIRAPGLNAFMMPNGAFFIQSGLLLRVSNSSELAAVIGHEASHYFRNHTIDRFRSTNRTGNTFAVLGALVSAASTVSINSATSYESLSRSVDLSGTAVAMLQTAQIVAALQLLDYSRDQESEADIDSVSWMSTTPYDPTASTDLWQGVMDEQAAGGESAGFSILATHPTPSARLDALRKEISKFPPKLSSATSESDATLKSLVNSHRDEWLSDEMDALDSDQFEFLMAKQVEDGYPQYKASYLVGLSFLNKAEKATSKKEKRENFSRAAEVFMQGIESGGLDVQPEIFRDLGKAYEANDMQPEAKAAYARYIEVAPDAWDAKFIKRKI